MAPTPGEIPFAIAKRHITDALSISDADLGRGLAYAARTLKLLVEPSGAAGLAALISGKFPAENQAVAVVLSGANGDLSTMAAACDR